MNTALMEWVWHEAPTISSTEHVVLLAIARVSDHLNTATASIAKIAKLARLTVRAAQKAIAALCRRGVLMVTRGGGRGKTNTFTICGNRVESLLTDSYSTNHVHRSTVNVVQGMSGNPEPETLNEPGTSTSTTKSTGTSYSGADAPPSLPDIRRKPASVWKRMVGLVHQVMDDFPGKPHEWSSEIKARASEQGLPYWEESRGRPLWARALDYAENVRQHRPPDVAKRFLARGATG